MLAYPIDEAETLLETKLKGAQDSLANCEEDLDFLREQITVWAQFTLIVLFQNHNAKLRQTLEVATARVYNWDVTQKRKEKGDEEQEGISKKSPNG